MTKKVTNQTVIKKTSNKLLIGNREVCFSKSILHSSISHNLAHTASNKMASFQLPSQDLESIILSTLANNEEGISDTWTFALEIGCDHQTLIGTIKSLLVDGYVIDEPLTTSYWTLTDEAQDIVTNGSPEYRVYNSIPNDTIGITVAELNSKLGDIAKIGMGPCMKNKWLKKDGDSIVKISLTNTVQDDTAIMLSNISSQSEEDLKNLKRRKLVQQITRKSYKITRGVEFRPVRVRKMADLTKEMLGQKSEVE